jgi:hypothetical protein
MAQAKQDLQAIINAAAEKEGLDPELLQKIGGAESSLRAGAKNPKSTAKGLFQFVDKTWAEMGGKPGEQYNPQKNAELGARYVKRNMDMLTQTLGREPSYGEVYAAHFFGPTGAKALLTKADPNAPIEQSLAIFESPKRVAKVLKQNPNLKGKTTAQVLADLDAKMGGKKPVVQETPTAAAPTTPAKPKMEMFRRPVPRFIRSEAPNLGTGYNAALALMGMTEMGEDQDPLAKAQETVAQAEEENSVADYGQAQKMLAQVQAPNAFANRQMAQQQPQPGQPGQPQQPQFMARGGAVKKSEEPQQGGGFFVPTQRHIYRAEDKAYLDEQLAAWNKYNEEANVYNQKLAEYQGSEPVKQYATAAEAYNAKLKEYEQNVYNPYRTKVDEYNAKLEAFNNSPEYQAYRKQVEDYNTALTQYQNEIYNPYKAQVDAYNAGLKVHEESEAYRNWLAAATEHDRLAEIYNAAPTEQFRPGRGFTYIPRLNAYSRNDYQNYGRQVHGPVVASGPYVGSMVADPNAARAGIPTYAFTLAPGYEFSEGTIFGKSVPKPAEFTLAQPTYNAVKPTDPTPFGMATPTEVKFGYTEPTKPADFTMAPPTAPAGFGEKLPTQPGESIDAVMARKSKADRIAAEDAAQRGFAINVANNPNQFNLAGFGSAGINAPSLSMFAKGGEVEAKPEPEPEKGSAKAMLKEVARSTQYLPADIAGAPVDLINLGLQGVDALTGSKLAQKMPVGGAEWLIDKANKYGLMDKPTGSLTETLTRIGTSVVSPVAAVKSAAIAGGKAASASRQALDEISELSSASRAKKAAADAVVPEAPVAPVAMPKATPAPAAEPAPKSQSRSMLDEIDPEIQKLINEPRAKGFEGPQQPKRTLTTPSPDRPFVSPLDKFFEKGNNPVTVEQLVNQLSKGSREYEMNRVVQLLADKSPKDKIRPSDLLKQLEETSPSRFRVQIKEPDPKNMGQFHASMENPFPSKPMGTVNLLEDITPQENLAGTFMRDLRTKKGFDYKATYATDEDAGKAVSALEVFFKSPMAKEAAGQDLSAQFKIDAPKIRELNKKIYNIREDMGAVAMPYSGSRRFGFDYFGEQAKIKKQALDADPTLKTMDDGGKTLSSVVDPILNNKAEDAILTALDTKYGTNLLGYKESMGPDWNQLSSYEKAKITERMMGDVVGSEFTNAQVALKELERPYDEVMRVAQANTTPYVGQHGSIADQKPISFSRFQDVTLPTKENVMVIPELQSDRYDDLLKSGAKGGNQYKDADELAQLEQDLDSVTRKLYKAGDAKDAALRDQLKLEGKKIEQRMVNLRERLAAGEYTTPEFIPGIERMPQVMQQIMIKNAVYAGIQRGKNGVLFPGSDSAQAQLYEKLPNNLRSVIKDLGSGFEIRKVPLTYEGGYPQGRTVDRYGIFWKDDAAKRISKEGVRFKKGGMVDKNDADNQKYI